MAAECGSPCSSPISLLGRQCSRIIIGCNHYGRSSPRGGGAFNSGSFGQNLWAHLHDHGLPNLYPSAQARWSIVPTLHGVLASIKPGVGDQSYTLPPLEVYGHGTRR